MTDLQNRIDQLDADNKQLADMKITYCNTFVSVLAEFIETHNLDDIVERIDLKNPEKIERGRLRVSITPYKNFYGNGLMPAQLVFYPFKKDGEVLSNIHRIDKFEVTTPKEYFDMILKIYHKI